MDNNDVAVWMFTEVKQKKQLDQDIAVHQIQQKFGKEFVYQNENGNMSIGKKVLDSFRKITGDEVIWDRGYKQWRLRRKTDKPGRQQD